MYIKSLDPGSFFVLNSFISLVNNKIVVYNDYIKICFAPRYLNKVVNSKNIVEISPVEAKEISLNLEQELQARKYKDVNGNRELNDMDYTKYRPYYAENDIG